MFFELKNKSPKFKVVKIKQGAVMSPKFTCITKWVCQVQTDKSKWLLAVASLCLAVNVAASPEFIAERTQKPCNPFSVNGCGLPYPSKFYSYDDASSATGKRIFVPDTIVSDPALLEGFSRQLFPSVITKELTGYSALTPILFEIPRDYDPSTLPKDGGDSFIVFDMTTGQRLNVVVDLVNTANKLDKESEYVIAQAYARGHWGFEHRIVGVLTTSLKKAKGGTIEASAGLQDVIRNDDEEYRETLSFLASKGIAHSDILNLTEFTVRDFASLEQPMRMMLAKIEQNDAPVIIDSVSYENFGWFSSLFHSALGARVKGRVRLSDFRQADGTVDYSPDAEAKPEWVKFDLYIPKIAEDRSVPVMIYGHPISLSRAISVIIVGTQNARHGVATLAIDFPYHGSRIIDENLFAFLFTQTYTELTGSVNQSTFDLYALSIALKNHLSKLDLLPQAMNGTDSHGDGIPELDPNQLVYAGGSLGTLFGLGFAALSPMVKGAYLELAGSNVGLLLNKTVFVNSGSDVLGALNYGTFIPDNFTPADAAVAFNLITHRIDRADGLNYARYFGNTDQALGPKNKALGFIAGINDQVVPTDGALSLAIASNLPRVIYPGSRSIPEELDPAKYFSRTLPSFENGSGAIFATRILPNWLVHSDIALVNFLAGVVTHGEAIVSMQRLSLIHISEPTRPY